MNNNYFSHDSNARNDERIIALRMRHGMEGYGVYFAIIERLRESKNYIHVKDYSIISFDLRVSNETVKSVIENFGLFDWTEDGTGFYSKSLLDRMCMKDSQSEKCRQAGKKGMAKRWGRAGPEDSPDPSSNDVITSLQKKDNDVITSLQKNITRKESKVKKSKVNTPTTPPGGEVGVCFLPFDENSPVMVRVREVIPDPQVREAFREFVRVRYDDGHTISETSVGRHLKRLLEISTDPKKQLESIDAAIVGNWKTVYPERAPHVTGPPKSGKRTPHVMTRVYDPNDPTMKKTNEVLDF